MVTSTPGTYARPMVMRIMGINPKDESQEHRKNQMEANLRRYPRMQRLATTSLALMLFASPAAAAETPALRQSIPADAVVAIFVTPLEAPTKTGTVRSSIGLATLLADQAQDLGLLSNIDATTRAWIDTLTASSALLNYPHAAALFEIKAESLTGGGHKLAGLSAALVVKTAGEHAPIEQRIQHLLNTYTNKDATRLTQESSGETVVYSLTDNRLPDWCVLHWGAIGDHYVISIGEGTFDRVGKTLSGDTPPIASDNWFATGYEKTSAKQAVFSLFARFDKIDFTTDSQLAKKVGGVRSALGLNNVDRGMWTVGFDGRAVDARAFVRLNDKNQLSPITLPSLEGIPVDKLIPPQATAYAIFNSSPGTALNASCEVFLAARAADTQEETRAYWRDLQEASGVDIHRDIVAHLARGAVIHNHPPHILRLPLAWTFVARVTDDPNAVHNSINALCNTWQRELQETSTVRLQLAPDGVWYLELGIPGPAVGMRGPWIVMSYSPFAVRENLTFLAGPAAPLETPPSPTKGPKPTAIAPTEAP